VATYATVDELRALDGLEDSAVFSDAVLSDAIDIASEDVEIYCGQKWDDIANPAPEGLRWCVRQMARQMCLDGVSRIPDRALQLQSEFGSIQLAQAGGNWRPTALPEVNARLNRYRVRLPFFIM
jgi:hypothetical protein